MKIDKAMSLIEDELQPFFKRVPKPLLNRIEQIVLQTRTVIKREIGYPERLDIIPNLSDEWVQICKIHNLDPVSAKINRKQENVSVRTHFVRYLYLKYQNITSKAIGRFLGRDHSTVLHMRDFSKVPCPIAPLFQRKVILDRV